MSSNEGRKREALQRLQSVLETVEQCIDIIIVEGQRDLTALRRLGYEGEILSYSQFRVNDYDLTDEVSKKHDNVLILTDFDREGREINHRLVSLFQYRGVKVEMGFRWEIRRIMASLGLYAIESLDDIKEYERFYY